MTKTIKKSVKQKNPVVMIAEDFHRLKPFADGASRLDEMTLAYELNRAVIVSKEAFPMHTVRLGSRVTVQDMDTGRSKEFTIVMPSHADMREAKLSILTPMGTALIGFRSGEEVEWKVPAGIKRFKILDVVNPAVV